jgi:hypothetical protein
MTTEKTQAAIPQPVSYRHEEVTERAYAAYCSAQSGVSASGQRHVPWQQLTATEKSGWMAATHVAISIATGKEITDQHALREKELRGEVPDNARPGQPAVNTADDTDEPTIQGRTKTADDDKNATSRKAHSAGR